MDYFQKWECIEELKKSRQKERGILMTIANLTTREKNRIKKFCNPSEITCKDILECVECYKELIESKDYYKARIIKYALYTILTQNASDKIILATENAIYEIITFEKLFSEERWDKKSTATCEC